MTMPKPVELTCHCPAYKFPHRYGGGLCTKWSAVEEVWNTEDVCSACPYKTHNTGGRDEPPSSYCDLLEYSKKANPSDCPGFERIVDTKKEKV